MPARKLLRILIGLRVRPPAADSSAAAEDLLREVEGRAGGPEGLRLAWNLPLHPWEGGISALAAKIKARVKSGADTLLLMGYGGAPHPLLRAEELDKEIAWCRRNPWGAGARGLFGQEARHLLPAAADLLRERQEEVYSRHGVASLGLAVPAQRALKLFGPKGSYRFLAEPTRPERAVLYHALLLPAAPEQARALAASLPEALSPGQEPLFLLFDLAGPTPPHPGLGPLLDALGARYELDFLGLEEALSLGSASGAEASPRALDAQELTGPASMEAACLADAARSRARRRNDADIRTALTAWGPQAAKASRLGSRARERVPAEDAGSTLVAAMGGLVALDGPGYTANFADGRFAGFQRKGRQLLAGQVAASFLTAGGRRCPFTLESAFSFEREDSSGLRTVLKSTLPNIADRVELVTHAYFPDRQKRLRLEMVLRFPALPPALQLEGLAPLELPLFRLARGERVQVTAELSEHARHAQTFPGEEEEALLYGTLFRFTREPGGPTVTLAPGSPAAAGVLPLPLRVARSHREHLFLVNPYGSYTPVPASAYGGRTLRFALLLGLELDG